MLSNGQHAQRTGEAYDEQLVSDRSEKHAASIAVPMQQDEEQLFRRRTRPGRVENEGHRRERQQSTNASHPDEFSTLVQSP